MKSNSEKHITVLGKFLICLILMLFFRLSSVTAADSIVDQELFRPGTPWRIAADKITYDRDTNIYHAFGDVKIFKYNNTLSADAIYYNRDTMEAESIGNVRLTAGKDTLQGDKIVINLVTGTGTIYNGRIFIEKSHFYISGDTILKTGENSYIINNGTVTSCDGDLPPWRITGKKVDIALEKYATVKNAALWTKKLPIFYVPYMVFPINNRRQSGLLPPQAGYSSRNGFEYVQPYFWAINDNSDTTFYYHHIQKRGEKFGAEYRYILSDFSQGALMIDSLNDRQIDNGIGDSSDKWGYTDDAYLRTNHDRYWFRGKLNQQLPAAFNAKMDIDIVSDQDYLDEFTSGYSGYDETKKYFASEFGRDIDDENDFIRKNSLNINKTWTRYSFNADAVWYDNVVNRRWKDTDPTLQQLPSVTFSALKQSIFRNRLFADLDTGYSNFYRKDGNTGQRLDLHPRIYLPMHYENYFMFEPSVGYRQTYWYLDSTAEDIIDDPLYDDYQHRELYDIKAELSTDLFHVYNVNSKSVSKIKHTLIPRLEYSYIPEVDQSVYPDFDDTDQIAPENKITFSLTNLLISKRQQSLEANTHVQDQNTDDQYAIDAYNQFLWFKIEQSYDFDQENNDEAEPFSPLYAELNLAPANLMLMHMETQWDHDTGNFTLFNSYCRFKSLRNDFLMLDYRYTRDQNQSVNIDFDGGITSTVRIFGNYERNLDTSQDIEKKIGCLYHAQCWSVEVSYKDKDNDRKIGFMITLKGLAEIGSQL